MPKYRYQCEKCDTQFMEIVSQYSQKETPCKCGGTAKKIFTLPTGVSVRGTFGEMHN